MSDSLVAALERVVRTRHLRGGGTRDLVRRAGLVEMFVGAAEDEGDEDDGDEGFHVLDLIHWQHSDPGSSEWISNWKT